MAEFAAVHLLDNPYHLDRAFDYRLTHNLKQDIRVGDFVTVPFGNANRKRMGIVVALKDQSEYKAEECKPLFCLCNRELSLNEEMLGLCHFLKEQTLCTLGDAARAVLPLGILSHPVEVFRATALSPEESDLDAAQNERALRLCELIRKKGSVPFDFIKSRFGVHAESYIKLLLKNGLIERSLEVKETTLKTEALCELAIPHERAEAILRGEDSIRLRSEKHTALLREVLSSTLSSYPESDLRAACHATAAQINALYEKGIFRRTQKSVDRSMISSGSGEQTEIHLNDEQTKAYESLRSLSDSGEAKAALLYGVTGSGKTSVMMKTIDYVLSRGKSVILLLPEIALTPQTLAIFCRRYGERVAILHSGLSVGERADAHRRIRGGGADVIIGTRSAIFAPVKNLGLVVIDEEQEHTYKSDMNPKYHTRDVARYRCAHHRAVMLLASATPSFESYKKAMDGTYTLLTLKTRYGGAELPRVTVADMRHENAGGNLSPLGSLLCSRLAENQKNANQSVLFLNRRGYNNFISCRSCGEAVKCPTCSVSMAYHTLGRGYDAGELRCHWCGSRMPLPTECPSCQSPHLARMGYGTQRVEQELSELLPDARVLRMDTDSIVSRYSYEEMLGAFRRREADVLLGTQMVTKGHDFPDVTLVGVLLADASLYLDDYRAAERTFAMLTQVIGRAGRAQKKGEAVIQTNNPDHECIRLACAGDYDRFYQTEIRLRRALVFPPFCDIVTLTVSSTDEQAVTMAAGKLSQELNRVVEKDFSDVPIIAFGPFEAPVYKVENRYRMRMVIKCRLNKRSRTLFSYILTTFTTLFDRNTALSVDFNPSTL